MDNLIIEYGKYMYAALIVLIFFVSAYVLKFIIHNFLRNLVKKSKGRIDDVILTSLERPFFYFLIIAGLFFAGNFLSLGKFFVNTISIFFIIDLFYFLISFLDAFLLNYALPLTRRTETKLDEQLLPVIRKIIKIVLIIIAIIIILDKFGYDISSLVAGLGIGGLAFALAAKDMLGNLFGGVSIFTDKPFKVGQTVKVLGYTGKVKEIGLRSTRVLTLDGTNLIIPNSKLTEDVVENVSMEDTRKVKLNLNLSYKTKNKEIEKAKKLIKAIVKKNKYTKDSCSVYFSGFNESSLNLLIIYHINNLKKLLVAKDEVNLGIKEGFEKNKIEFAYPTQTLYLRK